MKAHWYTGKGGRNFGDALTPVLFDKLASVQLELAPPSEAELFAIGSIAHRIPDGYTGTVLGTGFMFDGQQRDLRTARVLALRGPLTAAAAQVGPVLHADPGLLAGRLLEAPVVPSQKVGVVPHYMDRDLQQEWSGLLISILQPVYQVVSQVAQCERIVTSSLHALILADSLGIPSLWAPSAAVLGAGFKFRDYAASYGEDIVAGQWRLASQVKVAEKQEQLLEAMRSLVD